MAEQQTQQHRKECLFRYYRDMDIAKAKKLKSEYYAQDKEKAQVFVKRINKAKGYIAL